ncbi:glycosyltransferase [Halomonas sp. MC140]|nr:glycosyltransferase [Halomonas sp. MC140]MDN7131959.1 glycosyltransferase [Halomonas sp. MC140]
MDGNTLDIVFASDHNYIKYTAVTLASVLENLSNEAPPARVFILLDEYLDEELLDKFLQLKKIRDFELVQIKVDASQFENIKTTDGITIATYYRLVMHKLLPSDCHSAIYLDSDLIIQRSLHLVLAYSEQDILFYGVEDSISRVYNRRFGLPDAAPHVNAGVLLVNVELMRRIGFDEKVASFLDANQYRIVLGDQQIIAEVFHEVMKYLPLAWNVHGAMFQPGWLDTHAGTSNHYDKKEAASAISKPAIIHYTLKRKPWMSMEHPRASTWYKYLALTPFSDVVKKPGSSTERPRSKAKVPAANDSKASSREKNATLGRWVGTLFPAYCKSLFSLRKTRLKVERLTRQVDRLSVAVNGAKAPQTNAERKQTGGSIEYKMVNRALAQLRPACFSARQWLDDLGPHAGILSNVKTEDIDGGYAENIKSIFRTSSFAYTPDRPSDAIVFLSQRLNQDMFWHCLEHAYLRDKSVIFAEVALFGGFAGFFDQEATLKEKKALGFLLDDMGYYFDSHQASRCEKTLNDPCYELEEHELLRSRMLIDEINRHSITKYNKYVSSYDAESSIEEDCVLVVDQKKGDASIAFAGANDETFAEMMRMAIRDNPDKKIYFKRHPDSVHKNFNSYRNRNMKEIEVLHENVQIHHVLDKCSKVYTVSSQVGFEGLLRGKEVVCFGVPFYAGWGLTDDRTYVPRRNQKRKVEEIFHQICIQQSVYLNPHTGKTIELEQLLDIILAMRQDSPSAAVAI